MIRIDELIVDLCPDGVRHLTLSSPEVAHFSTGKQLNRDTLSAQGEYQVFNGGLGPSGWHSEYNTDGPAIIVSQGGASAGFVNFINKRFWAGAHCYVVTSGPAVERRYLFHVLKSKQATIQSMARGAGIPGLGRGALGATIVPVPPRQVQEEIVRILDQFTQLEAELEAELEARRRQYEYYRNLLVSKERFASNDWTQLSALATIRTGSKPEIIGSTGAIPYINAGTEPSGFTSASNTQGGMVTIPSRGQGSAGHVGYQTDDFWCGPLCYRVDSSSSTSINRFLYFFLRNIQEELVGLRKVGSIPAVNKSDLGAVLIPLVEIEEQRRIVGILDKFDALVNDLNIGLPAELAARRKQYEHYRDRLLTFEGAPA